MYYAFVTKVSKKCLFTNNNKYEIISITFLLQARKKSVLKELSFFGYSKL